MPGLFDTDSAQKSIILSNISDAFLNKGKLIEILSQTPHLLIATSSKLSSRSKLVSTYREAKETALLPCYEINKTEISEVCQCLILEYQLKMTPEALAYLINFSTSHLENFFSIFDLITLYTGLNTLDEVQIKNILMDFYSLPADKFNQHFLLTELSLLHNLGKTFELSDWIGIVRILTQDIITLLAFHGYRLRPSDLKNCWSKGPIKFPYPRLALYEKALSQWNLQRCKNTLDNLLELERRLKSTSSFTSSQILYQLIELSSSD